MRVRAAGTKLIKVTCIACIIRVHRLLIIDGVMKLNVYVTD